MNWKLKAGIQNAIAALPSQMSYDAYYKFQRTFGGLKTVDYLVASRMEAATMFWDALVENDVSPHSKRLLEVGTGRVPLLPISFWLMGAGSVTTVDLNPYVESDLVKLTLDFVRHNRSQIETIFGDRLVEDRLDKLIELGCADASPQQLFDCCSIDYLAPSDAADTSLPAGTVDIHFSYTVLEHIPEPVLGPILREASRLLAPDGVCLHYVDYSDHFSHSDKSISAINFLKYNDRTWGKLADNRYMYMNRLRHDDMTAAIAASDHKILNVVTTEDDHVRALLGSGELQVDERFVNKSADSLAITRALFLTAPVR